MTFRQFSSQRYLGHIKAQSVKNHLLVINKSNDQERATNSVMRDSIIIYNRSTTLSLDIVSFPGRLAGIQSITTEGRHEHLGGKPHIPQALRKPLRLKLTNYCAFCTNKWVKSML
jgi:hypothetical protein